MATEQLLSEIREANLSYLVLVQSLVRQDRAEAVVRLGLSEEMADILSSLTMAQILRIASSAVPICRFRFDDRVVWELLADESAQGPMRSIHASIVMASQPVEVIQ